MQTYTTQGTSSTAAAAVGTLTVKIGDRFPLQEIAKAHDRVDTGGRGRVLITVPH